MDAVRLDEGWNLRELVERAEAGETVEIMRGDRVVAKVVPGEPPRAERPESHPSWKEAGFDWDELRRFRESLPYDPTDSVEEMRRQARY